MDKRPEKNTEQDIILDIQLRCAKKARLVDLLTIFTFVFALFATAILFIVLPDKTFSEQENRALQQFPKVSYYDKPLGRLLDGSFTLEFAKYYADQFPARDFFVGIKGMAEIALLKQENNSVILGRDGYLITRPPEPDLSTLRDNIDPIRDFASLMKKMNVPVTLAIAGRTYDVMKKYLPETFPKTLSDELWEYARYLAGQSKDLLYINLADPLRAIAESSRASGPLYYRTDHHWTTLGAYYAYAEIMKAWGETPAPLSEFTIEAASDSFYGTTWSKAGLKWIKPDTMEYFRFAGDEDFITEIKDTGKSFYGFYDRSYLDKKDKYSSFIGGNNGRVDITRAGSEKREKLLIMKDSFAHAMIPFFAMHYDLVILDLRYFSDSVSKLVLTEGIDRVLIVGNMENLTQSVIYRILGYGADEALAAYIKYSYPIRDIQVNGNSIAGYTIVYPDKPGYAEAAKTLHDAILERTGFDLMMEASAEYDKFDRALVLADTGIDIDGLIKITVEGDCLYFRSTAPDGITGVVNLFLDTYIKNGTGAFNFPEGYIYADLVNTDIIAIMP
ncbi:MAG TPA: hypothetical protein GXX22_03040 [Clostridiales bacterium]|nr:hypothetical protein [Clostridiales bacterium]